MSKIFVLDTNVLIHNPQALFTFEDNHVVIPIVVIEEIDHFKKGLDEKGRNARQIGRYLDQLRENGSLQKGVKTEKGGIIQVVLSRHISETTSDILITDTNDNLIIGTALYIKKQHPDNDVILISKDANVRIKADAVGLKAENFEMDKINFQELYTGFANIKSSKKILDEIKSNGEISNKFKKNINGNFFPNQFIRLVKKLEDEKAEMIIRYSPEEDKFKILKFYLGQELFGIKSRNDEQTMAFELLLDPAVKLVSLLGKAGTGKTLIALAAGLNQVVEEMNFSRLVVSRPISPLGKDLGFLPG